MLDDLFPVEVSTRSRNDECDDGFAPFLVRHADDAHFGDPRERGDRPLRLGRIDVFLTAPYHVLVPAGDP
jgi:hypothetical protein